MGYYPLPLFPFLSAAYVDTGELQRQQYYNKLVQMFHGTPVYIMRWSIRDFWVLLSTWPKDPVESRLTKSKRSFLKTNDSERCCEVNSCSKSAHWVNKISIVNWKYHTSSTSRELCFVLFLPTPHLKNNDNVSAAMLGTILVLVVYSESCHIVQQLCKILLVCSYIPKHQIT